MVKLLKNLTKKDFVVIFFVVILTVFSVFLDLRLPEYMSEITRLVQSNNESINPILVAGGHMLICAVLSLICVIVCGYCTSLVGANFSKNVRKRIFEKVESFGVKEIKKFSTSSLITRTTNDVSQIEMLLSVGIHFLIKSPVMAIWALMKILGKSSELSLITGIGVILIVITNLIIIKKVTPRFEKMQKYTDDINGVTRENLMGIRVIRAFNAETFQEERFENVNDKLADTQLKNIKTFAVMSPMMNFVMHFQHLGIYLIGSLIIIKSTMLDKINMFSNMVVFSSYGMQVIISFLMLTMIFMVLPRARVSATRLNEVLDEMPDIKDGNFEGSAPEVGTVEFKNVSFKYPDADEYLLKDISFKVSKGETVAFIGSTGSGKSTLINLIPRLYDVTDGEVLVDGINVKNYKLSDLNNKIGYVPQKAVMFTGTVFENVAYGDKGNEKVSLKQAKEAIKIAQAEDFVLKLENNYSAHIARGGTNISGGQKQRLAIARAIARNPEIYIFDDSFSALDYQTDLKLRKELRKYTKDATHIIVAQRIGTIMNADKILVLDRGVCVGMGTHKELLSSCDVYKEIALSQLSEEELYHA